MFFVSIPTHLHRSKSRGSGLDPRTAYPRQSSAKTEGFWCLTWFCLRDFLSWALLKYLLGTIFLGFLSKSKLKTMFFLGWKPLFFMVLNATGTSRAY